MLIAPCVTARTWPDCIDPAHRKALQRSRIVIDDSAVVVRGAGDVVARRSLEFYDALGRVMAVKGNA